ncbi:MAG: amidophosphoribosyltransferase [Gammaproteobacteria bacterium]|nr:amidophosphoribosyltransferase [Pseudomonadota bacterium]MCH9663812.1 amidophosphoribosyltransferase [Gammaproteobacteria bacterium]
MCGIIGIVAHTPVNLQLYEGLSLLQHRGQDAAGLLLCDDSSISMHKDVGLVRDVFSEASLARLRGCLGIGHVRYPTSGTYFSTTEIQPLFTNYPYGIALAHNGNLVNSESVHAKITQDRKRHLNTTMDSEVLLNMLAHQIQIHTEHSDTLRADDIFYAISGLNSELSGAYAVVGVIPGRGLFAFRDPLGIRPLCLGVRTNSNGRSEYCVSSESAVFDLLGFKLERDVAPGEAIFITPDGELFSRHCAEKSALRPCLFEYVYLARPDSMLDGVSVYQARVSMGSSLARHIKEQWPDYHIDAVIPIPESARAAALEVSYHLGVRYREGLVKNRYIDRTFIMPSGYRGDSVRRKLSAIEGEFRGRDVLLVDDSIVRGTTSAKIIALAKAAGARRVYFASAAPPVKFPNVYGINIPTAAELIAHNSTTEQIRDQLGCDRLFYQDLQEMREAINTDSGTSVQFEDSCFSGEYLTADVDNDYLSSLNTLRSTGL